MAKRLQKPKDPYDPLWVEYARQNPGLRRSLSAADAGEGGDDDDVSSIDLSEFVPETFKKEDGSYDTAGFRGRFDELLSQSQQQAEIESGLPKSADELEWGLPEGWDLPDGIDADLLKTVGEDGEEVEFDPAGMIKADDPDVKSLQSVVHKIATREMSPQDAMKAMAGMLVTREVSALKEGIEAFNEQRKALGEDGGKARLATIERELSSRMDKKYVDAVMNDLTSARAVFAVETLIKKSGQPPAGNPGAKPDTSGMSNVDLIQAGL